MTKTIKQMIKNNKNNKIDDEKSIPPMVPINDYNDATTLNLEEITQIINNIYNKLKKQNNNKIEKIETKDNEENKENKENENNIDIQWKHKNQIGLDYIRKNHLKCIQYYCDELFENNNDNNNNDSKNDYDNKTQHILMVTHGQILADVACHFNNGMIIDAKSCSWFAISKGKCCHIKSDHLHVSFDPNKNEQI